MSFVISRKQYLAPNEAKAQYEPIIFGEEGFEVERIDVSFGHPLYTTLADIFYIRSVTDVMKTVPVIPDGCISLVFKGCGERKDAYICGAIDEIKKIDVYPEECYVFIRFLPGTGYPLAGDDAGGITNKTLDLRGSTIGGDQIISVLERDTSLEERIRLISKVIRIHMQSDPTNKYLINYCTERIFQNQGNIRMDKLAAETGFTTRHIGKMFEKCVGLSPKLYSQVIRLQASMNRIMEARNEPLVDIAVDCGFFDHAHMNRTYKKLIKCSSGEFRKSMFNKLDYDQVDDYIAVN